jgi:hypothetical protein
MSSTPILCQRQLFGADFGFSCAPGCIKKVQIKYWRKRTWQVISLTACLF